ncbi:MAG: class I SAM-dependent methyltransferase [Bacteroidales bacterium]|nr:class I SAM-dependent methyltransferase [Bacteroidales bacterium]
MKKIKKWSYKILAFLFAEKFFTRVLFLRVIDNALKDCKTILELGSGKSSCLTLLKKEFHKTALDISDSAILASQEMCVYDDYIKGDVRNLENYVKKKSFDAVVAFDLIEHLKKKDGYELIHQMTEVAKKAIIIYTPNGFLRQDPFDNNPYQEHLSGWDYEEMQKMGFKVYGINGFKKLRKEFSYTKIRPAVFGNFISNLSWIILILLDKQNLSFSILAVKKINT